MRLKTLLTLTAIVGLVFITAGDLIFPPPLSQMSRNTRISVDRFVIGLFPQKEVTRPSQERESQVQMFETRAKPSR